MNIYYQQLIHTTKGKLITENKKINMVPLFSTYPQDTQLLLNYYIIISNCKKEEGKCYSL